MTYIPPKSDGGPAFPHRRKPEHLRGMSLLDYFAGLAMQGMIAQGSDYEWLDIAIESYQMADLMIAQREYWIARRHKQEEQP